MQLLFMTTIKSRPHLVSRVHVVVALTTRQLHIANANTSCAQTERVVRHLATVLPVGRDACGETRRWLHLPMIGPAPRHFEVLPPSRVGKFARGSIDAPHRECAPFDLNSKTVATAVAALGRVSIDNQVVVRKLYDLQLGVRMHVCMVSELVSAAARQSRQGRHMWERSMLSLMLVVVVVVAVAATLRDSVSLQTWLWARGSASGRGKDAWRWPSGVDRN
jgi:hypothetical protein